MGKIKEPELCIVVFNPCSGYAGGKCTRWIIDEWWRIKGHKKYDKRLSAKEVNTLEEGLRGYLPLLPIQKISRYDEATRRFIGPDDYNIQIVGHVTLCRRCAANLWNTTTDIDDIPVLAMDLDGAED